MTITRFLNSNRGGADYAHLVGMSQPNFRPFRWALAVMAGHDGLYYLQKHDAGKLDGWIPGPAEPEAEGHGLQPKNIIGNSDSESTWLCFLFKIWRVSPYQKTLFYSYNYTTIKAFLKNMNIHNKSFISLNVSNLSLWSSLFSSVTFFRRQHVEFFSNGKDVAKKKVLNANLNHWKIRIVHIGSFLIRPFI